MGNFGCCQGKPVIEEDHNQCPVPEMKKHEEIQTSTKIQSLPTINVLPCENENQSPTKKHKMRKSCQPVLTSNNRRLSEMPKICHEDLVQLKHEDIEKSYSIISVLGKGGFGCVYKAQNKISKALRAVKVLKKESLDSHSKKNLLEEVEILKSLSHPNILKIFEVYEDSISINIVTELCTGGELFDRIVANKGFSENKAAHYMYQIMSAVRTCHKNGIVHRDLKPENILFIDESEDSALKIIDFGTSKKLKSNSTLNSLTGTVRYIQIYYIAPEVIKGSYDLKCDIWSCGVLLYVILSGYPPFRGMNSKEIVSNISRGHFSFTGKEWVGVSTGAKSLIMKMLTQDPKKRPSAADVLNDHWIQSRWNSKHKDSALAIRSIKNLSNFRASGQLQKIVMEYMADQLIPTKEKNSLCAAFMALDTDGDGKLSVEELKNGFLNAGHNLTDINMIIESCDEDGNGFIEYSEFLTATINWKKAMSKQKLEAVFKSFDKDNSGAISLAEIKEFFGEAGKLIEEENWSEMMKEADLNGDGQIDLDEFIKLMLK